eukprot:354980-Chlamydomonas_euryale.AAC.1
MQLIKMCEGSDTGHNIVCVGGGEAGGGNGEWYGRKAFSRLATLETTTISIKVNNTGRGIRGKGETGFRVEGKREMKAFSTQSITSGTQAVRGCGTFDATCQQGRRWQNINGKAGE